jgi:hypothetical protein
MTTSTGSGTEEGAARQEPIERITVSLIARVEEDLRRLQERTNLSKTDVVNRAITIYEFLDAQLRAGNDVIVRDNKTGESQVVMIL